MTMTTPSHRESSGSLDPDASGATQGELRSLFRELVERSGSILQLDAGQRRAWVSGLLSAWRSDVAVSDPDATDADFVAFVHQEGPALVGAAVADAIKETADALCNPHLDTDIAVGRSWIITDRHRHDECTAIFTSKRGDSEYSILGSAIDGVLADLQVSGEIVELIATNPADVAAHRPSLEVSEVDSGQAIETIVAGWSALAGRDFDPDLSETLLANQLLVRADLVALGVPIDVLPLFCLDPDPEPVEFFAGCSATEVAEGNRWALEALTVALRPFEGSLTADSQADSSWQNPVRHDEIAAVLRGPLDLLSRREQQALVYLEWADWVGAIVAIVSAPDGVRFDGETIIEGINARSELTSAIEESDHDWVAYAFDVALAVWSDADLVVDGRLVPGGRSALVQAAKLAWTSP